MSREDFMSRAGRAMSPRNISALYLLVGIFLIFSLVVPDTFLQWPVWRSVLDFQALYALAAIAVVIPLAAGAFNLAVGAEVGFAAIVVAVLMGRLGWGPVTSIGATLLAGAFIGLATGLLVTRLNVNSLIATLGTSSILAAGTAWVSDSQQILGLPGSITQVASTRILGLTSTTWLMLGVATISWYYLECTPVGRRVYATGGNENAARLAGVNTALVTVGALTAGGAIAALTGVLATARTGAGDPTVGLGYLLPAFAAAMLGSTQLRGGRFNIWGAVLAVYVLAAGIKGLQLAGAPVWIPDLFNGLALIAAVSIAARQQRAKTRTGRGRSTRRSAADVDESTLTTADEPTTARPPVLR